MPAPALFFGTSHATVLAAGEGLTDDGQSYDVRLLTNRAAPAGAAGECLFTAIYFVYTTTMAATVRLTPILDGVRQTAEARDLTLAAASARTTRKVEIGLSVPLVIGGATRGRNAMRGTWLQIEVRLLAAGPTVGELIFDGIELEYEVVDESLAVT